MIPIAAALALAFALAVVFSGAILLAERRIATRDAALLESLKDREINRLRDALLEASALILDCANTGRLNAWHVKRGSRVMTLEEECFETAERLQGLLRL